MNFRKDINGLRGLGLITVLAFHFHLPLFSGGLAGLDIFFVISGFLMTAIIVEKIDQNTFSLLQFYLHRARRIIPALAVLCLFLLVFGFFFFPYDDYRSLTRYTQKTIQFISNIAFTKDSGYFDAPAQYNWLLHTWSLSAEWQFYLFYPLILLLLFKLINRITVKYLLLILALLSYSYSVYYTPINLTAAYYLLPTRMWEMLAGGIIYLFPFANNNLSSQKRIYLHYLGLFLIFLSVFKINDNSNWPGYLAAIPVIGAMLIVTARHNEGFITSNRIIQFLGNISYSTYLWHWPIVVFLRFCNVLDNNYAIILGLTLSLLLGTLSYFWVEKNFKLRNSNLIELVKYFAVIVIITAIAAFMGSLVKKYPSLRNQEVVEENMGQWLDGQYGKCIFSDEFKHYQYQSLNQCIFGGNKPTVIVTGDSHSVIFDAVKAANSQGASILRYYAGCPTLENISFSHTNRKRCTDFLAANFKELDTEYPDVPVIVANRNAHYLESPANGYYHVIFNNKISTNKQQYFSQFRQQYINTICRLTKHRPVYILKPIPYMGVRVGGVLAFQRKFMPSSPDITISMTNYKKDNEFVINMMEQAAQQCGAKLLDPVPYLCPDGKSCLGSKDGQPLYMDDNHLNKLGDSYLIPLFKKEVFNNLP